MEKGLGHLQKLFNINVIKHKKGNPLAILDPPPPPTDLGKNLSHLFASIFAE
jgi:hypothetical protein